MNADHSNSRDEQFWFTAAAVGFNTIFLTRERLPSHTILVFALSLFVSLFGAYLVLTRWLAAADRRPPGVPEARSFTAGERWRYTRLEFRAALSAIPLVVAEFSGGLFYLCLILITCAAVTYRCFL
jgi:hypothetical protein